MAYKINKVPSASGKNIVHLEWIGDVPVREMDEVNVKLKAMVKDYPKGWYIIPDVSKASMFSPEANEANVKQQQMFIDDISICAVVLPGSVIAKMQRSRTAKEAGNTKEQFFQSFEDALEVIEKHRG
ncbi:hypothetical protein bcgnr5378_37410 [Bacillus cereus]|uniref:Uncharacterized protein n=1 Tax=Bacillus cereus TaxID=1396 RepID=A0A162PGP8_BACCE|nr:hypothetical protein [Bacillus cereus]KZD71929.1 hypothetical protein B4088_0390 [Bacillus cereus]HDR8320392.1 hypothetical protein [Bacillus cereus]HDR8328216.1 hypothetical protein [Bacillus cereus]HDR8336006.1 hypothetical protein [Bacillus cereus]